MKTPIFFIACILVVIITLTVVHVAVANNLSTAGIQLAKLQQQINSYKTENIILEEQVLQLSSLTHIASQAAAMGFVEQKSPVYISTPLPLALNQ